MSDIAVAAGARKPDDDVQHFLDLARNGTPDERKHALDRLARIFHHEFDFERLMAVRGLRYPSADELAPPPDSNWYLHNTGLTDDEAKQDWARHWAEVMEATARAKRAEDVERMRKDNRRADRVARMMQKKNMTVEQVGNVVSYAAFKERRKIQEPKLKKQPTAKQKQQSPINIKATGAEALATMKFEPIKYVVPGIIVEGLTLLAGKPKIGKSWLLLDAAIAVASGDYTLGHSCITKDGIPLGGIQCPEGDVLYCALEDNLRRLQSRMQKLLPQGQAWPKRLTFMTEIPRLGDGGLNAIWTWITQADKPRLVIIDTLAMVKQPTKRNQTAYEADYDSVLELRKMAAECKVAIIIVHHLRKAEADDAFDTVSGTLGLTGAPDSVLVLARDSSGGIVLHGKGRDLEEFEKAMEFDRESCTWRITGDASDVQRSTERGNVLRVIAEADEPVGANEIAAEIGTKPSKVRFLLHKLKKEGAIARVGFGKYQLPSTKPSTKLSTKFEVIGRAPPGERCSLCGKGRDVSQIRHDGETDLWHRGCAKKHLEAVKGF
jgi:AAA domain/IclR helix-turn-helix domain